MFELDEVNNLSQGAKIKVIGVGGGGGNAVNTMIRSGLTGVEFINANTDNQALQSSLAQVKLQIGHEITKGLGAGANPDVGRRAALEDYNKIAQMLEGSDMVFITAGMGGGTGTGAAPVIAKIAKEIGALTVGVVTKPFDFEGRKRKRHAEEGIRFLKESVDSLITIPNQRLLALAGNHLTVVDTFLKADEVLLNAVQGISDLINHTGLINSDFADVRTIMADRGLALMGTGIGTGEHRAIEAATNAISSPLLEDVCIDGATGLIINITGGSDLTTYEVNEATTLIMEAADEDAEIIFGTVIDDSMKDRVKITVIATGIGDKDKKMQGTQAASLASTIQMATQVKVQAAEQIIPPPVPTTVEKAAPAPIAVVAVTVDENVESAPETKAPEMEAKLNPATIIPKEDKTEVKGEVPQELKEQENAQVEDTIVQGFHPQPATLSSIEAQVELFDKEEAVVEAVSAAPVVKTINKMPEVPVTPSVTNIRKEIQEIKEIRGLYDLRAQKEASAAQDEAKAETKPTDIKLEKPKLSDLERAKQVARNLGVTNLSDDEYDIPTFIRRQQSQIPPQ